MTDFESLAREQLLAEDRAAFDRRVMARARQLRETARQLETSDLRDPLTRLKELQARHDVLEQAKQRMHPGCLSAVDDDELSRLPGRIAELTKAARLFGLLPRTAA